LKARSKPGAWGWAITDGYAVWIVMAFVAFGRLIVQAIALNVYAAFGVVFGALFLGLLVVERTRPWVAKQMMHMLGA